MKKRNLPLILGIVLILCSLCLLLGHQIWLQAGSQKSARIAGQLEAFLPERTQGTPMGADLPALALEGAGYCALLEAGGQLFPVASAWSRFSLTPGRFSGGLTAAPLVIGGNERQFAFCSRLDVGSPIILTDMTGAQYSFSVSRVDRAAKADADWLQQPGWELVLFCRDSTTMEYIAVRCKTE